MATWTVKGDNATSELTVDISYKPKGMMGVFMKKMIERDFNKQMFVGLEGFKKVLKNRN